MNRLYRCLIVEDEVYSTRLLIEYLKNYPEFYTPKLTDCISGAKKEIRSNKFDLIFLDLHLPDGCSLDLVKSVAIDVPVILVTGDKNFSLEAFDLDVVDYVLKPVTRPRFDRAIGKVMAVIVGRRELQKRQSDVSALSHLDNLNDILVKRYNLSPTESSMCRAIAEGKNPEEILDLFSITRNTYKTHMKKIFSKTIDLGQTNVTATQGKLQRLTWFLLDLGK